MRYPFEVWVNGNEQPRGLGAVAKTLSMDMRAQDRGWLRTKLDVLARSRRRRLRSARCRPTAKLLRVPSIVAAFARIVRYRVRQLGALADAGDDIAGARRAVRHEGTARPAPTARCRGRSTSAIRATGDDFVLVLKELRAAGTASAGRTRCGCPATIRGRSTACASCCRSTCA